MNEISITTTLATSLIALVALAGAPPAGATREADSNDRAAVDVIHEYLGTKKCRMCHSKQYQSLLESPKGRSWEALMPGARQQAKIRAGLDVHTDYRTDGRCLRCHSVGYGQPGGYAIPDPDDRRSERLAAKREGVGCESCHGPGSGFVRIMRDIWQNERKYRIDELRAMGRKTVGPDVCRNCHNDQAICMVGVGVHKDGTNDTNGSPANRSWLDVDVTDRHGFHAKFPLKYRISAVEGRDGLHKNRPSANGKPNDSFDGNNR